MINAIGFYDEPCALPAEHPFQLEDRRYDPVVGAGLAALGRALRGHGIEAPDVTACIGITGRGCSTHVARVSAGIADRRPRQAFFARAGAQTIASYAAMALGCHGPTLTFSVSTDDAGHVWSVARLFAAPGWSKPLILIAADQVAGRSLAVALHVGANGSEPLPDLSLQRTAGQGRGAVQHLYAAAVDALARRARAITAQAPSPAWERST